ncbi:MAG: hypothetical protein AB9836_07170 [Aminipila sp.]
MTKEKFQKEYRVLCLAMVAIVCIILTGAGRGHLALGEILDKSLNDKSLIIVNDNQIDLTNLVAERWILRINYDVNEEGTEKLSILQGYTGDNQLLGNKMEKQIALVTSNAQEWFPTLWFDAYDWFDEEKGVGIISLVLTKESQLAFTQLQDTTLYEQLPDYAINNLKDRDSSSVQKTQVYTTYDLQEPIEGLKTDVKLTEPLKMTRNIKVIMPEII